MLPLDDPRWQSFKGGYRILYDASPVIRRLLEKGATSKLWEELWNELHHQGDVNQASYAAVPWLVEFIRIAAKIDWNALALIATIELERGQNGNPHVESDLESDYFRAIQSLPPLLGTHSDE